MSKKRTLDESENDEKTNEDSGTPVKQEGNARREKLDSLRNTTILYLPFELVERILVTVVVTEVKELKMAKSVWKEKADLVVYRLKTVCLQWSNVLATKSFRTKLHRILDNTAQTFRFTTLLEYVDTSGFETVALKDEIFMLEDCDDHFIGVYDRNDWENQKAAIKFPTQELDHMAGCSVSNCLYACVADNNPDIPYTLSILRISREPAGVEPDFKISPWKSDHKRSIARMRVATNGSVLILSELDELDPLMGPAVVSIYDANGALQHEVVLPLKGVSFTCQDFFLKSNGNLVFAYACDPNYQTQLLELDMSGRVIREYNAPKSPSPYCDEQKDCAICIDNWDRIMIPVIGDGKLELLDSEFNLIGRYALHADADKVVFPVGMRYDNERQEITQINAERVMDREDDVLIVIRLTEE